LCGKPGNVRHFDSYHGFYLKSGKCREIIFVREK